MKVVDHYDQHGIRSRTWHWDATESTAKPLTDLPSVDQPRPVDLEIYEPRGESTFPDWAPVKPYRIKINGVEVLTPENAPTVLEGLVDKDNCAVATIKVFVRSLKMHHESDQL